MTRLGDILSVARWLSIDVVIGGVILCEAIGKVAAIALPWSIPAALACSIWLIYTLDHLIDGNKHDQQPSMPRHTFHRNYRKPIFGVFVLVAGFGLVLLFHLPGKTLVYGCVLLGLVGLYFLSIWMFKIYFAKELFIAVLYSCGIFLGVYSLGVSLHISLYFLFFQLILLAFINLLLFSYFEVQQDKHDGHQSWVTHFGEIKTVIHLRLLFGLFGGVSILSLFFIESGRQLCLQIVFMLMASVLGVIHARPERFKENEQFRWVGDMIFFLPASIFLL